MPRSFIDPFSNGMVLSQFDLIDSIHTPILGQMPLQALGPFLHEATHFWCNNSPVGLALLALEMRARRNALDLITRFRLKLDTSDTLPWELRDTDDYWQLIDDVVRLETARRLLRPISEGLALFMEYDAFPLDAMIISPPMASATALFRGRSSPANAESGKLALINSRLVPITIRRKAALLMEPLRCEPTGYLPGYLFLKFCYAIAVNQSPKLVDSELLVHFVKSAIYDSWDLVDVILDPSKQDIAAVNPIAMHIQERIADFPNLFQDSVVGQFEQRGLAGDVTGFDYRSDQLVYELRSYPATPCSRLDSARESLRRVLDDSFGASGGDDVFSNMNVFVLALRDLLVLGEARFHGAVTSGNMLQLRQHSDDKWPIMARGNNTKLEPGWKGEIDVGLFLTTRPDNALYTAYCVDQQLLSMLSVHDKVAPEFLKTPLVFRHIREPVLQVSANCVARLLKDDPVVSVSNEATERILDKIFLPRTTFAKDEELSTVIDQLKSRGFLDLLEGDESALYNLAVYSLAAGVHADKSWAEYLIVGGADEAMERLNTCLQPYCGGRKAISTTEDAIVFSVV